MRYDFLPKEIQNRVKFPFVFVSYCHKNRKIYDKVQAMVLYLRSQNINVVYDEGGLEAGTELTQFENLILDTNCKLVLVISDKCYLEKIENNVGGAWREYFNISNDYPNNTNKYLPLLVDATIPIFSGKVYIPFEDEEQLAIIEKRLSPFKLVNTKRKDSIDIDNLIKEADALCDSKNYNAALRKINQAIRIYNQQKKISKVRRAKLYNLKLVICIYNADIKTAITVAEELEAIITGAKTITPKEKATYFCNCALAYRMRSAKSSEYEESAKKAYNIVKNCSIEDDGYYSCMYATALYDTEQYTSAYKICKDALKAFEKAHNNKSLFSKDDYKMYIKIKGNLAEIAVASSKTLNIGRNKKLDLLSEAQTNILDIINIIELEDADAIRKEIYSIAQIVFYALYEYYVNAP